MKCLLENDVCCLTVESFGGAIVDLHLKDDAQINPLGFAFTPEQMPENNKNGAPYRGHFLCAGRWGQPSAGEIKNGVPNHGEAANIAWQSEQNNNSLFMQTLAKKEGLQIERTIELDEHNSIFAVSETFTNINTLGRVYNVVQHPTIAAPFLNGKTIINCNATTGFDQAQYIQAEKNSLHFPGVKDDKDNAFNLKNPEEKYNSVFSFVVDEHSNIGWLTAYSPVHNLLFGYIWKRSDYPWIHLWQHWNEGEDEITYRGLEFGTAGIHQPFSEILNTATHLFGEKTFAYIDAGESVTKKYFCFIHKTGSNFTEPEAITVAENSIQIRTKEGIIINLATSINLINELPG